MDGTSSLLIGTDKSSDINMNGDVNGIAKHTYNGGGGYLERPDMSIVLDIFYAQDGVRSPYLVLDEVTAVKNAESITFAAIDELRKLADMCIMITGS
ncbi:hypothetical protein MMC27_005132 [Xylographa pallens]|nr:hypothetical protein [Xylographa pallens]